MNRIFLSHSTKDQLLANALHSLFSQFIVENGLENDFQMFYSPINLSGSKVYSTNWKEGIKSAMADSKKVIILWTPNSIENRWVNYELGLATAQNKQIIAVGVKGIDFDLIIPNQIQTDFLDKFTNIKNILDKIFEVVSQDQIAAWASCSGKRLITKVNELAHPKCVYFVGSERQEDNRWNNNEVELFVRELSKELLKAGFKLASFPSVPHVGKIVASCALAQRPSRYEIAGLYKFDGETEQILNNRDIDRNSWNKTIEAFREIYLKNKDCMIIIGGGKNTRNEYDVATKDRNRQIFPIPCFGGFASEMFDSLDSNPRYKADYRHPCTFCDKKRDEYGRCPHIHDFVKRLNEYVAIPND